MGRIAKKAITMIIACMMVVYMSLPVMASHTHSYLIHEYMNRSTLTTHMNGACTIYQLHWIKENRCYCGHTVLISKQYIREEHSMTHP